MRDPFFEKFSSYVVPEQKLEFFIRIDWGKKF